MSRHSAVEAVIYLVQPVGLAWPKVRGVDANTAGVR